MLLAGLIYISLRDPESYYVFIRPPGKSVISCIRDKLNLVNENYLIANLNRQFCVFSRNTNLIYFIEVNRDAFCAVSPIISGNG